MFYKAQENVLVIIKLLIKILLVSLSGPSVSKCHCKENEGTFKDSGAKMFILQRFVRVLKAFGFLRGRKASVVEITDVTKLKDSNNFQL